MTDRPAKQDVTLVGDEELVESVPVPDDGGYVAPTARRRRRLRWWPVAVLALLLASYGVQSWTERRAVERRIEALAGEPGFLPGFGADSRPAWTIDRISVGNWRVHGGVLVTDVLGEDNPEIVGYDLATGRELWRRSWEPDTSAWCDTFTGNPASGYLACQHWTAQETQDGAIEYTASTLLVLDAATGRDVLAVDVQAPHNVLALGDSVWWIEDTGSGPHLTGAHLPSGRPTWSREVSGTADAGADQFWLSSSRGGDIAVHGPRGLQVYSGAGERVLVVDRTALDADRFDVWWLPEVLGVDRYAAVGVDEGGERFILEVRDADGTPVASLRGRPVTPLARDHTATDVVLTAAMQGSQVEAWDLRTDELLMQTGPTRENELLLLDGALISVEPPGLVARHVRSGGERWRAELQVPRVLGTDGRVVLVAHQGADRATELSGVSIADGRTQWTAPLGGRHGLATARGGVIFVELGGAAIAGEGSTLTAVLPTGAPQ